MMAWKIRNLYALEKRLQKEVEKVPPFQPHTCRFCNRIVIDMPNRPPHPWENPPGNLVESGMDGITAEVVVDGAKNGCALFASLTDESLSKLAEKQGSIETQLRIDLNREKKRRNKTHQDLKDGYLASITFGTVKSREFILGLAEGSKRPAWLHEMWNSSPIVQHGLHSYGFYKTREWYSNCHENAGKPGFHSSCRPAPKSFVPTRLIVVPDRQQRHVEISGSRGRLRHLAGEDEIKWCSLSYCWGGPQAMQTTTTNFQWDRRYISVEDLPRTILDALLVADQIGVKFLWVDSLCIIQDSVDDVQKELANMAKIYQYAAVTIIAANATKVTEGFLNVRTFEKNWEFPPIRLRCQYEGKEENIILHPMHENASDDPIHSRGWTFQEMLVSPRLLIFGSSVTTWSCLSRRYHDCDLLYPESDHIRELSWGAVRLNGREEGWDTMVEQYSQRRLTMPGDRLKALAAVAETYHHGRLDWQERSSRLYQDKSRIPPDASRDIKYVGGLRSNTLSKMLLWHYQNHTGNTRQRIYCAPTWSWASVTSTHAISFERGSFENITAIIIEPKHKHLPYADAKAGSTSFEINCKLANFSLGRQLDDRGVRIPYLLKRMTIEETSIFRKGSMKRRRREFRPKAPDEYIHLDAPADDFPDWNRNIFEFADIYMLPAERESSYTSVTSEITYGPLNALLLRKIPGKENSYTRVGTCKMIDLEGKAQVFFGLYGSLKSLTIEIV